MAYLDDSMLGAHIGREPGPFRAAHRDVGERLLRRGDPVERIALVESGLVLLSTASADGEEQACCVRGPGSLVGFEGWLGLAAFFDARALTPLSLQVCEASALDRWLRSNIDVMKAFSRCVAEESARLAVERRFLLGPATHRLARFLVERESNPLVSAWRSAPLHVVAGLLAMRPETLSRALRSLQKDGLVEDGREIRVRDLEALAEMIGETP